MACLSNKCGVRKVVFSVVLLILIAVGGGLIIWQFLPEDQKQTITTILDNGIPIANGDAPPPTYPFNQCSDQANCCNGLESICELGVDTILYAGIHNAQSTVQEGFFVLPNHQFKAISALDYGFRALNFDIGVCNEELVLVHGLCKLGTTDPSETFTAIQNWLDENPSEVILIPIQIDNSAGGGDDVDLGKFYNLLNRIDGFTDRMYEKIQGSEWPTLRELIDLDERIIMFHYNGDTCGNAGFNCPPGFHDWFAFAGETRFEYTLAEEFEDKAYACEITRGRSKANFYALNLFTSIPSREVSSTLLNTQAFLEDHIQACSQINNGLDVNVLFVDFWEEGDLPEVVQNHNSNLANQRRKS